MMYVILVRTSILSERCVGLCKKQNAMCQTFTHDGRTPAERLLLNRPTVYVYGYVHYFFVIIVI